MSIDTQKTDGSKTGAMLFVRETQAEIRKVSWPTRKETVQTTIAVVLMALVAGVFFFAVDSGLGYVVSHILGMNS